MEWGEKVGSVQFVAATSVVRVLLRELSVWGWDSVLRWDLTGSDYFHKRTPWSLSQSYLFAASLTRASVMAIFMLQALMPNVPRVSTTNSDNSTNTKNLSVAFLHSFHGPGGRLSTLIRVQCLVAAIMRNCECLFTWRFEIDPCRRFEIDPCCLCADFSRPCMFHVCKNVSNIAVIFSRVAHIEIWDLSLQFTLRFEIDPCRPCADLCRTWVLTLGNMRRTLPQISDFVEQVYSQVMPKHQSLLVSYLFPIFSSQSISHCYLRICF